MDGGRAAAELRDLRKRAPSGGEPPRARADSPAELADIRRSFAAADPTLQGEPDAACCHARSDKHWATDPQGVRWEGFHSRGLLEDEVAPTARQPSAAGCCAPAAVEAGSADARPRCCA